MCVHNCMCCRDDFEKQALSLPPVGQYETWHAVGDACCMGRLVCMEWV